VYLTIHQSRRFITLIFILVAVEELPFLNYPEGYAFAEAKRGAG
jgi:hypothetical protein